MNENSKSKTELNLDFKFFQKKLKTRLQNNLGTETPLKQ